MDIPKSLMDKCFQKQVIECDYTTSLIIYANQPPAVFINSSRTAEQLL